MLEGIAAITWDFEEELANPVDLTGKDRDIRPIAGLRHAEIERRKPEFESIGVKAIQEINEYKAGLLYDFIDNSSLYKNYVNVADRSIMNVPFVTGSEELDAKFVKEATANGFVSLKGHRLVGGMRASIYNAMPVEGVKALIEFMKKFELENK